MGAVWNPLGLAGLAAGVVALAMAAAVARRRPGAANRRLALVLGAEGLAALTGTGLIYFVDDEPVAHIIQLIATAVSLTLPSLYLLFLATLPTRAVAFWRGARGASVALGFALLLLIALVARPSLFVRAMEPTWYAEWEAVPGPLAWAPVTLLLSACLYGLFAALAAHREAAPATMRRIRARAYAWAFGTRDILLALVLLAPVVGSVVHPSRAWELFPVVGFPVTILVYVPILAYGILRTQLFDVDLRLKGNVQRGVVFAVFIFAYVVVSQIGAALLSPRAGTAFGVAAAGALAFAILPLDRSAARVADALMPRVRDEEGYLAARRLEVYRAALEDAGENVGAQGELAALRASLGVTDAEHGLLVELVRRPRALSGSPLIASRYVVLRKLGEGGGGATILARDDLLGREVVLKHVRHGAREALAEARALALVHDPHVVVVHDAIREGNDAWVVMEHVAGGSLEERLRHGLDEEAFARVARGLLSGLAAMHAISLVHRDVKPANVLLTPAGDAKLADFGLAGALARADAASLRYASPERRSGAPADAAGDLWSAMATLREAAPRSLDGALGAWFERGLAADAARRFTSAKEALVAFEGTLRMEGRRAASARPR